MKDESIPMFHARRTNFSLMQWVLAAVVIVFLLYGFYAIYDLRRVNEYQRELIAKLTHEEEALREQMKGTAEEKNKMAKLMENENSRHESLVSSLKEEKLAVEKDCTKDKHGLDVTIKDLTEKNTECKGQMAVLQRDKGKIETDYNDLHEKFTQVNKNLQTITEERAEERTSCNARVAALEAKLAAAQQSAGSNQAIAEGTTTLDTDKPPALETAGVPQKETEVPHEIKEPIIAQMAPPKNVAENGIAEDVKKEKDAMQVAPPRNHPEQNAGGNGERLKNDMQVESPKMAQHDDQQQQQPLVGHFRDADENNAREEA